VSIFAVFYEERVGTTQRAHASAKRLFDIAASAAGLCLLSPVFAGAALLVFLDDGLPILYRQQRVGKNNTLFTIYKFRTMRKDTPQCAAREVETAECFTRTGKLLRAASIDELPQLANVLKGNMSLVGYRPLIPEENEIRERRATMGIYSILPGMTGWAQVNGRAALHDDEKLRYDEEYLVRRSLLFDIRILLQTAAQVLLRKNI
jgi:O-antigen biosynthesis protein WbqP